MQSVATDAPPAISGQPASQPANQMASKSPGDPPGGLRKGTRVRKRVRSSRGHRSSREATGHDSLSPAERRFRLIDIALELTLVGLLAFSPFAFGVVESWSEYVVVAMTTVLAVIVAGRGLITGRARWHWSFAVIAVFVGWVTIQQVPLPAGVVGILSPSAAAFHRDANDGTGGAMTLSLYPYETAHHLRLLLTIVVVFLAVTQWATTRQRIRRLMIVVGGLAAAVMTLQLAQLLSGARNIYWVGPEAINGIRGGPFILRNHFGNYVNIALGMAVGLLVVMILRRLPSGSENRRVGAFDLAGNLFRPDWRPVLLLFFGIVVGVLSVFLSGSRSAMTSLLVASLVLAVTMSRIERLPGRGWVLLPIALVAIGLSAFVGVDVALNRLTTLRTGEDIGVRWTMFTDQIPLWSDFPLTGVGFGAFNVAYPMYDSSTIQSFASHAENEWAQLLSETGLFGLALAGVFLSAMAGSARRVMKLGSTEDKVLASGLIFCLVVVAWHSMLDFAQHLPANNHLTAVACGLLVAMGHLARQRSVAGKSESEPTGSLSPRLVQGGAIALAAVLALWCWPAASSARQAERLSMNALSQLGTNGAMPTDPEAKRAILEAATGAVDLEPANAALQYQLNAYRWATIAGYLESTGTDDPQVRQFAERLIEELQACRQLAPTMVDPVKLASMVQSGALGHADAGRQLALEAARLDANDAWAREQVFAAVLDGDGPDGLTIDDAGARLMATGGFSALAERAIAAGRLDVAESFAGDRSDRLRILAAALARYDQGDAAAALANRATDLERDAAAREGASASQIASLAAAHASTGDHEAAIAQYRRALALNYGQVDWRLALAQLLAETDQLDDAIKECRIVLRLRPQSMSARKMLEELVLREAGRPVSPEE